MCKLHNSRGDWDCCCCFCGGSRYGDDNGPCNLLLVVVDAVATNRRRVTAAGETLLSPAVICAAVAVARDSSSGWQISNADSIREWLMYGVQVLLAGNHMYGIGNTTKRFVIVGG